MREKHLRKDTEAYSMFLDIYPVGSDVAAVLSGGDKPHIGCAVIAVPRPSLKGDGSISCTSSVINVTGHKDEIVCREAAELICKRYNCTVTCTGGIHIDKADASTIASIREDIDMLLQQLE